MSVNKVLWTKNFLIIFAGFYLALLLVLVLIRLFYPYELEWIEGAYVNESIWVASGRFPYTSPTLSYLPTSKTPFYFYVAGLAMKLLDNNSFFAPRLVSILATFGTIAIIFILVSEGFQHPKWGFVAAGLYAATFQLAGSWMDLAKTDSLCFLLIILGFWLGISSRNAWLQVLSGVIFVLAFFTKQIALPIFLVMAPLSILFSKGRSWIQWTIAAILGGSLFWWMDFYSQGWFSFYAFQTSVRHTKVADLLHFWKELLPTMLPALLLVFMFGISILYKTRLRLGQWPEKQWRFLGFGLGLVLASWSIFLKVWTYKNGLMPAALGLALLSGSSVIYFIEQDQISPSRWSKRAVSASYILIFFQFILLFYNPSEQLPSAPDRKAGDLFINRIRDLPGQVWIVNHSAYTSMVDKPTFFHNASYSDVATSDIPKEDVELHRKQQKVKSVFLDAINNQRVDWLIIGGPPEYWMPAYIPVEELFTFTDVFIPVTGAPAHPEMLMAPNPIMEGGVFPLEDSIYDKFFIQGWQETIDNARWISGEKATLQIALDNGTNYDILFDASPACLGNIDQLIYVEVGWNEFSLGNFSFEPCNVNSQIIDLPSDWINQGLNDLWFSPVDTTSQIEIQNLEFVRN
jgi:hypothetical protein